jgi:hypothetical protein
MGTKKKSEKILQKNLFASSAEFLLYSYQKGDKRVWAPIWIRIWLCGRLFLQKA